MDFTQFKGATLKLADSIAIYLDGAGEANRAKRVRNAAQHLAAGQVLVVVAGEFKQGKSSLVNALLATPGLVPVEIDIATNVVSLIRFGEEESYEITLDPEPRKECPKCRTAWLQDALHCSSCGYELQARHVSSTRKELEEYATEGKNPRNSKGVQLAEITLPAKILKDGICLVDTPGIGGLYRSHSDLTYQYLPRADVVLYVSDCQAPLKEADLAFLKERVWPNCRNVIYVVTRKDKYLDFDQIVQSNRATLAHALDEDPRNVRIVPVSTSLKLDFLDSGDPADLQESGYLDLEEALWDQVVSRSGKILLERCLDALEVPVSAVLEGIHLELCALKNQDQRKPIEAELDRKKASLQQLQEGTSSWRTTLSDGISDMRLLQYWILTGIADLRVEADKLLQDDKMLAEPILIGNRLKFSVESLATKLEQEISDQALEIVSKIDAVAELGMKIDASSVVFQKGVVGFRLSDFRVRECTGWERAAKIGTAAYRGAAVLTVISGLLNPYLLVALGAGLAKIAVKDANEQIQEKRRADVRTITTQFLNDWQTTLMQALTRQANEIERAIRDDFGARIKARKAELEDSIAKIGGHLQLTATQAQSKSKELAQEQERLAGFAAEVKRAKDELDRVVAPPKPRRLTVSKPDLTETPGDAAIEPPPVLEFGSAGEQEGESNESDHPVRSGMVSLGNDFD